MIIYSYFRKKRFYQNLLNNVEKLDKAYLVLETIEEPSFYEGQLLYQALYSINKSICERVKQIEDTSTSFQEYIEMWVHEVKVPLSALTLMLYNHKDKLGRNLKGQVKRIENDIEQVLYYARQGSSEKDYLIKEVSLNKVIGEFLLKNKDTFLENKMDVKVDIEKQTVYTDSKWLTFILGQIIQNSMQYKKEKNAYLHIFSIEKEKEVSLLIMDNGIGIPKEDIKRVFDKSFTGKNGRKRGSSTGMGLYICKNLCKKLGHKLEIESEEGEYTKVSITFPKNKYYEVVK